PRMCRPAPLSVYSPVFLSLLVILSSTTTLPPVLYTLSLHDALPISDGLTHAGMRAVAAHNILGVNDALVAIGIFHRDSNWELPFFAYFEANERPSVIRGDARRALLSKAGEVIQDACLVHRSEEHTSELQSR